MSPPRLKADTSTNDVSRKEDLLRRNIRRTERRLERAEFVSNRFALWRGIVFISGALGTLFFYGWGKIFSWLGAFALLAGIFGPLTYFHSRLKERILRMKQWRKIKLSHLDRLTLNWPDIPGTAEYPVPHHHPFAHDLDIAGEYSLLRLVDLTVSTYGASHLTSALLFPELNTRKLEERQKLVLELKPRSLLRDRILLEAKTHFKEKIRCDEMMAIIRFCGPLAGLGGVLILEGILAFLTSLFAGLEYIKLVADFWVYTLGAYVLVYLFFFKRLKPLFDWAQDLELQLEPLENLFKTLEKRNEEGAPFLRDLCAPFHQPGESPSFLIRRIKRICEALSIRGNPLIHIGVNLVLPWDLYFAFRYEKMRAKIAHRFPLWLETLAKLEAFSSIAQFAALHPDYAFPDIQGAGTGAPSLKARSLGHPLIPSSRRINNDFNQDGLGSITLLTGSNMSGKSTFLRTVGINVCLAQAGGPVCAESFSIPLLRVQCCLRIEDSLEEGLSYFYTEVKRLKQILDSAHDRSLPPVLFLVDEIFKGTNNRERIIGSACYLKELVQSNGLGLVTTHDLELASLSKDNPGIVNFHFQETLSDSALSFDYRLQPGPCSTTNALKLMAMEGLPVPRQDPSIS